MRYRTESPEETVLLGRNLGQILQPGDLVILAGELGCGKTWFTKGIALGLGVPAHEVVTSPSFALMNEYEGQSTLFHMDVYRLENVQDFLDTGLDECFDGGGGGGGGDPAGASIERGFFDSGGKITGVGDDRGASPDE